MTNDKTAKIVKHEAHYGWDGQLELPAYFTVEIFENGERVNFARCEDYLYGECTFNEIKSFSTEREALEWVEAHELELETDDKPEVKRYEDVIDELVESAQSVVRYNRLIEITEEKDDGSLNTTLEDLTKKRDSAKNDYFVAVNVISFIYGVDVSKIRSDVKYRREFIYD